MMRRRLPTGRQRGRTAAALAVSGSALATGSRRFGAALVEEIASDGLGQREATTDRGVPAADVPVTPQVFPDRDIRGRQLVAATRLFDARLRGQFGASVSDRTWRRRFGFRRNRLCGLRRSRGGSLRQLFAFLPEIPALAFGDAIDAVVPMAALGRLILRSRKGNRLRRAPRRARWSREGCLREHWRKLLTRNFAVRLGMCTSGERYATLHAPNLRKDLGRNEPQFRTA